MTDQKDDYSDFEVAEVSTTEPEDYSCSERDDDGGEISRNTLEQKRKMRNLRKKRKRAAKRLAKEDEDALSVKRLQLAQDNIKVEEKMRKKAQGEAAKYKGMARTYFDRYCWEVQQRRTVMKEYRLETIKKLLPGKSDRNQDTKTVYVHNEINPANLLNPLIKGERKDVYLGRGSFGIVKMQMYRGLKVAVKEYLPRSVLDDVKREASFLSHLCHPYLPLLIGITTKDKRLRLVMQFHGVSDFKASTMWDELKEHQLIQAGSGWLILTIQLLEALKYLHTEVEFLHNDIKANNILLTRYSPENWISPSSSSGSISEAVSFNFQVVLIDFGKASLIKANNMLRLSESERHQYKVKHPSIAPEVIDGIRPYSTKSDIYATGNVIQMISQERRYYNLPSGVQQRLIEHFEKCLHPDYTKRPEASVLTVKLRSLLQLHEDVI